MKIIQQMNYLKHKATNQKSKGKIKIHRETILMTQENSTKSDQDNQIETIIISTNTLKRTQTKTKNYIHQIKHMH